MHSLLIIITIGTELNYITQRRVLHSTADLVVVPLQKESVKMLVVTEEEEEEYEERVATRLTRPPPPASREP